MKKIMFDDKYGLTEAVLRGRKTMTRRIILNLSNFDPRQLWMQWGVDDKGKANIAIFHFGTYKYSIYPQYQPGEVLAVAQNYHDVYEEIKRTHGSSSRVTREFYHRYVQGGRMPVSNKMFVRADLMPHQIRITDIKVEHLQDISEEDCLKEGIYIDESSPSCYQPFYTFKNSLIQRTPLGWDNARDTFAALIDAVSGKGTWERNPRVFVYEFEVINN